MSKLIVVSNRVAVPGASAQAGGLAVALNQALKVQGGVWCGWSGEISDMPVLKQQQVGNVEYLTMDMTGKDYTDFYKGFCNSMLWPLFHYRMDLTHFSGEMYHAYEKINKLYAEKVAAITQPGDMIWAHDYHLLTFAQHMRHRGVKERLGFFLHIPFPVPEVFVALPYHMEILKSLCAYDVIGFQTNTDLQAFLRCVNELAGRTNHVVHDEVHEVHAFGRKFKAGRFSISIDTEDMMIAGDRSEIDPGAQKLKSSLRGRDMIIGVDRLDYTKGIAQRLEAYQHFLQTYPEHRNKVTYIQITPPSRSDVEEYEKMREQVESLAGRINGMNADVDWVPIRYVNKSFSRDELAGFYRAARVGMVTPMRDGMNLVAKEYVAAQNPADPGVLLLSKFAGAATELACGALMVNPYDVAGAAEQLRMALKMSLAERKERYDAMMIVLKRDNIFSWSKRFLSTLSGKDERQTILWPEAGSAVGKSSTIHPQPNAIM